jgi:hypothetical protein
MTPKSAIKKILKEILSTEDEYKHTYERMRIIKPEEMNR